MVEFDRNPPPRTDDLAQKGKTMKDVTLQNQPLASSTWMSLALKLAAVYNIAWGAFVVLFPTLLFEWAGMALPEYPEIWQSVGMILAVYGLGYWIASRNPLRHWPIVLVGFLGKVFGPIGFLYAASTGSLPWIAGLTILTNDIIWLVPFALILYRAYRDR